LSHNSQRLETVLAPPEPACALPDKEGVGDTAANMYPSGTRQENRRIPTCHGPVDPLIFAPFLAVCEKLVNSTLHEHFSGSGRMTTVSTKPADVRRDWYVVDADGKTLGRLATEIARRLRGKHKPEYTPHVDTGDYIVVINAEKIRVTGNKLQQKMYHHHTGYIGNLKSITLEKQLQKAPERVIETAVRGMMPKNKLGRAMFKKLRVYAGSEHQHTAQQPIALDI
jgi:large subunit ribosomal protein L13